jgi:hypothetical protein
MDDAPTSDVATVRMPKVLVVELSTTLFWATDVATVYKGWAPNWYGHQICGLVMVSDPNAAGVNDTV